MIHSFPVSPSRKILGSLLSVFLILLLILGGIYFMDPYHLRMVPGVTIGTVDVSGMYPWDAHKLLKNALETTLYSKQLQVMLPEETITLSPTDIQPDVKLWDAVLDGFQFGRSKTQTQSDISLLENMEVNEAHIRSRLEQYAQTYNTKLTEASWQLEGTPPELSTGTFQTDTPCQTLSITRGLPDSHLDIDSARQQIQETLANAISACEADAYSLAISVTPSAVPAEPDLDAISQAICTEAINDSLDMETYQFVHGQYGYRFDREALQDQLSSAEYGQTVSILMEYVEPEILGDAVYFRDILGAYETKHTNNENRNTNLRLLCAAMDGFVLQPGEEFSFNTVVGERTAEKGYKPAPAYSGSRLVDSIGGGVCQGSTTIYNCVLLADLEVVFRACHGATVSYVPLGLDATVNFLTTDFKFRNNFHFPIQIRAEVSDGYVKMKILGTDEKDYYIKMETRTGDDELAYYSRSYKCKYDKETNELLSREIEAYSTYYKNIG